MRIYVVLDVYISHFLIGFLENLTLMTYNLRNDICFERESSAECWNYFSVVFFFHLSFILTPEALEHSKFLLPSFLFGLYALKCLQITNASRGKSGEILILHFISPLSGILAPQGLSVLVVLQNLYTVVFLIFHPAFIIAFFKRLIWYNLLHYSLKKFLKIHDLKYFII